MSRGFVAGVGSRRPVVVSKVAISPSAAWPTTRAHLPAIGREDHCVEERGEVLVELPCGSGRRIRRTDVRGHPPLDPTCGRVDEHEIDGGRIGADYITPSCLPSREKASESSMPSSLMRPPTLRPVFTSPQVERAQLRRHTVERSRIGGKRSDRQQSLVTHCHVRDALGDRELERQRRHLPVPRPIRAQVPDPAAGHQQPGVIDHDIRSSSRLRRLLRPQPPASPRPKPADHPKSCSTRSSCHRASTSPLRSPLAGRRGSRSAPVCCQRRRTTPSARPGWARRPAPTSPPYRFASTASNNATSP